jgi:hypothetical protein
MENVHVIANFNPHYAGNLPAVQNNGRNFYFVYNQYVANNNRGKIRTYLMAYINYLLYITRNQVADVYPPFYAQYIEIEYNNAKEIMFSEVENSIINDFSSIIDVSTRNQKKDIYNIFNIHNF